MGNLLGKGSSKLLYRFLLLSITLGYAILWYYNYRGYLSLNLFVSATLTVLMSIPALLFLSIPARYEIALPNMNLGKIIYILPYCMFFCVFSELRLQGHSGLISVITLVGTYTLLVFSRPNSVVVPTAVAVLAMPITLLYNMYTPSFGWDTWRDAIQAAQIIAGSGLKDLTFIHQAYPIPIVPLLYAVFSVIMGLDTLWSSSILGLLYLLLLVLWVYILVKHNNATYSHMATILALTTSLIVIWSVGFIPQSYSLLITLPILFLDLHLAILIVLALALVLGHAGSALWTLIVLVILALTKRFHKFRVISNSVKMKLIIVTLIFVLYVVYTTLSMYLKGSILGIVEAFMAFLGGEEIVTTTASIQRPLTAVVGTVTTTILAILGLVVLLEGDNVETRLLALTSLVGLGISYMGAVTRPALGLPRYLGLASVVVLAVLSQQAIYVLIKRGRLATCYVLTLVLLSVVSFGFAGILMPRNPYTANPYSSWSLSGLITYSEALELNNIASKLCCNNFLIDYRAGRYIKYMYLWIKPLNGEFYYDEARSMFKLAGTYGLIITPEHLKQSNELIIFRVSALNMPEVFVPNIIDYIQKAITIGEANIFYQSKQLMIFSQKLD